jgi:two-component sensor histidine kinase
VTSAERFGRLPTAAKLLFILTAVLLPIGIALAWVGNSGIHQADAALQSRNEQQAKAAATAIEGLIARNALAMRVAAANALRTPSDNPCLETAQALASTPAITQRFSLRSMNGDLLCTYGGFVPKMANPSLEPGAIRVWLDPTAREVVIQAAGTGGMVTASVPIDEIRKAASASDAAGLVQYLELRDADSALPILASQSADVSFSEIPIGNGNLIARIGVNHQRISTLDRLLLLLPLLMWIAAAIVTWFLVSRLLIRPLKRLEQAVVDYQPGSGSLDLPRKLGPSQEIQELRDAFGRAVARVEQSETEMTGALEGQRKLVREVHHRVKNNLQVVASLLNIHGRNAGTPEAQAAYAGISRRVGALSIVHRNHFAEMEESRGIALRPLVTELGAELRAGAPEAARAVRIDLDIDSLNTTQDVAVAVAFLITEIVEHAMLNAGKEAIEISLRRTSDLTARLSLSSPVLVPEDQEGPGKVQFERIVGGLAKQLRSTLERKLGRYSVDLPVFPPA